MYTLHRQSIEMILKLQSLICQYMYRPVLNVTVFSMLIGIWRLSIALTLGGDRSVVKINEKFLVC